MKMKKKERENEVWGVRVCVYAEFIEKSGESFDVQRR